MNTQRFRRGDPFDIPENPDILELMLGWFFDNIRVIVSVENHIHKFDGITQLLDILHTSAIKSDVNCTFAWQDGQWYLMSAETPNDILNLPIVLKKFSKVYRHQAREFSTGENSNLKILSRGEKDEL